METAVSLGMIRLNHKNHMATAGHVCRDDDLVVVVIHKGPLRARQVSKTLGNNGFDALCGGSLVSSQDNFPPAHHNFYTMPVAIIVRSAHIRASLLRERRRRPRALQPGLILLLLSSADTISRALLILSHA